MMTGQGQRLPWNTPVRPLLDCVLCMVVSSEISRTLNAGQKQHLPSCKLLRPLVNYVLCLVKTLGRSGRGTEVMLTGQRQHLPCDTHPHPPTPLLAIVLFLIVTDMQHGCKLEEGCKQSDSRSPGTLGDLRGKMQQVMFKTGRPSQ